MNGIAAGMRSQLHENMKKYACTITANAVLPALHESRKPLIRAVEPPAVPAAGTLRVTGAAGSLFGALSVRPLVGMEGVGSSFAKAVLSGRSADKAVRPAFLAASGSAVSGLGSAGLLASAARAMQVTRPAGSLFGALSVRPLVGMEGVGTSFAKAMLPAVCGPTTAGSALAATALNQNLRVAGSLFAPRGAADTIRRLLQEERCRWDIVDRTVRKLDLDAAPRPDRWRDSSPVIALAACILRLAEAAETVLVQAMERTTGTASFAVSPTSPMSMPLEEVPLLLAQLEFPTELWHEPWEQILQARDAMFAAWVMLAMSLILVFTVRVLARERIVVPLIWDAALFLLRLLMSCRRLGARGDDSSHQMSLLRRQGLSVARRIPAVR
ncbi:hypothetical protein ACQEU3_14980 [Spirillospora sp. CA-253888]